MISPDTLPWHVVPKSGRVAFIIVDCGSDFVMDVPKSLGRDFAERICEAANQSAPNHQRGVPPCARSAGTGDRPTSSPSSLAASSELSLPTPPSSVISGGPTITDWLRQRLTQSLTHAKETGRHALVGFDQVEFVAIVDVVEQLVAAALKLDGYFVSSTYDPGHFNATVHMENFAPLRDLLRLKPWAPPVTKPTSTATDTSPSPVEPQP